MRLRTSTHIFILLLIVTLTIGILSCAPEAIRSRSRNSSSTATSKMNLETAIELLDVGIQDTSTVTTNWNLSETTLDTNAYDGSVTYFYEVIADNSADIDAIDDTVSLVSSAGPVVASITIPANGQTQRLRTQFNPSSGSNTYKVRTVGTGDYKIYAARIIVQQIQATKTKIYIPLSSGTHDAFSTSTGFYVTNPVSVVYVGSNDYFPYFYKDTSRYSNIASGNPWTLEAVISNNNVAATTSISLFNATTNQQITASETSSLGTGRVLVTKSFSNTATNFSDGSNFELRIKSDVGGTQARIHRAGLWLNLEGGLSRLQSFYRVQKSVTTGAGSDTMYDNQRMLLQTSLFNNPTVYFETSGYQTTDNTPSIGSILEHVGQDLGAGGANDINQSQAIYNVGNTKLRSRTGSFSFTDGARVLFRERCLADTDCRWIHGLIIIDAFTN